MSGSRLVYSSDGGRVATTKDRPKHAGSSDGPPVPQAPDDGWVRLWRIKGGRGGKTVTVVTGISEPEGRLNALAVELRRLVGAGGSVRGGAIEVHGDHRQRVQQKLAQLGYRVKLAGG